MSSLENIHQYGIDEKNREIYLHSYMDSPISEESGEGGVDFRSAVILQKNIRYLDTLSLEPVLIHMHLPGGHWEDCMSMFDCIRSSKSRVILLAYGRAESSSGVILQSAKLRILMPNSYVMIHVGSFGLSESDHSRTAISHTQWNEKESAKMIDIFTDRCMESELVKTKKWKKMITKKHIISQLNNKGDWILPADEAVYYGFADGILGSKKFPNIDYLKTHIKKHQ
jgi:ATP-dependent protease ClpP protease subunit